MDAAPSPDPTAATDDYGRQRRPARSPSPGTPATDQGDGSGGEGKQPTRAEAGRVAAIAMGPSPSPGSTVSSSHDDDGRHQALLSPPLSTPTPGPQDGGSNSLMRPVLALSLSVAGRTTVICNAASSYARRIAVITWACHFECNKPPSADSAYLYDQVTCGSSDQSGRPNKKRKEYHSERKMKTEIAVVKTMMTLQLQRGQKLFGQLNCIGNLLLLSTILELTPDTSIRSPDEDGRGVLGILTIGVADEHVGAVISRAGRTIKEIEQAPAMPCLEDFTRRCSSLGHQRRSAQPLAMIMRRVSAPSGKGDDELAWRRVEGRGGEIKSRLDDAALQMRRLQLSDGSDTE
ncbi:hypothetical protein D1007_23046 [Hordeum vulgare]|nr:hypothetical protein D1007_23046 [Hordeum vulgare]